MKHVLCLGAGVNNHDYRLIDHETAKIFLEVLKNIPEEKREAAISALIEGWNKPQEGVEKH